MRVDYSVYKDYDKLYEDLIEEYYEDYEGFEYDFENLIESLHDWQLYVTGNKYMPALLDLEPSSVILRAYVRYFYVTGIAYLKDVSKFNLDFFFNACMTQDLSSTGYQGMDIEPLTYVLIQGYLHTLPWEAYSSVSVKNIYTNLLNLLYKNHSM